MRNANGQLVEVPDSPVSLFEDVREAVAQGLEDQEEAFNRKACEHMDELETKASKKYLKNNLCPICESNDLDAGNPEADGSNMAGAKITCNECGSSWVEVWKLEAIIAIRPEQR